MLRVRRGLLAALVAATLWNCTGVVSKGVRNEAVHYDSFGQLRESASRYRGETVVLGGELIETRNKPDHTVFLVLERPLGAGERPKSGALTGGRFMVRVGEYLDPVLFAPGRLVTVAGVVAGEETELIGEAPYRYLLLDGREVHLWKEPASPPWPPHDPWYPYWYDPYWGRRPWWW